MWTCVCHSTEKFTSLSTGSLFFLLGVNTKGMMFVIRAHSHTAFAFSMHLGSTVSSGIVHTKRWYNSVNIKGNHRKRKHKRIKDVNGL